MALYVAFALCCVAEFVFVPWFLKVMWPNASKKSLLLKMICASLFVAVGVLSIYIADNHTEYAYTMLDLDDPVPADLANKLGQLPGVLRVRVIR